MDIKISYLVYLFFFAFTRVKNKYKRGFPYLMTSSQNKAYVTDFSVCRDAAPAANPKKKSFFFLHKENKKH